MATELLVAVAVVVVIFGLFALVHLLARIDRRSTLRMLREADFEDTLPAGGYTDEAARQAAAAMPFPETEAEKPQVVCAGITAAGEPWKHGAVLPFAGPEAEAVPFPEQGPEAQAHGFPEDGPHMAAPLVGPEADAQPFSETATVEEEAQQQPKCQYPWSYPAPRKPFPTEARPFPEGPITDTMIADGQIDNRIRDDVAQPFPEGPERQSGPTPEQTAALQALSDFDQAAEAMPFVQEDGGVVVLVLDASLIGDAEDGQMSSDPTNVQMREAISAAAIDGLQEVVRTLQGRLDAAYEERNRVVAALATCYPSTRCKTDIDGWNEDWHNCVYIQLPTGQVSWHYHDSDAKLFKHVPAKKTKWDGHSTSEKYSRVRQFTQQYEPRK